MIKRILSLLLALSMILGMTGMTAFAEETGINANDYSSVDVAAIDTIITVNGLNATKNDPASWRFVTWGSSAPKRITALNLDSRSLIGTLDVSALTELTSLTCRNNGLVGLNLSALTALQSLNCEQNQIEALSLTTNTVLKTLFVGENSLKSIDVSKNIALEEFYCHLNKLSTLNISANTGLKKFRCDSNDLTALDVTSNKALIELRYSQNRITYVDTSALLDMEKLECFANPLTSLSVAANTKLTLLDASDNNLTAIDLTTNTLLQRINLDSTGRNGPLKNNLATLDVTKNTELIWLKANNSSLTTLDVSKNTKLRTLIIINNQITNLDLTTNTQLTGLYCAENGMTSLILPNPNTLVIIAVLEGNNLTNLDLSGHSALSVMFYGIIPASAKLDVTNKSILQLDIDNGIHNIDELNYSESGENLNLDLIARPKKNEAFVRWEFFPALSGTPDLTANPISVTLPKGITTATAIATSASMAPTVITASLAGGTVGTSYTAALSASGSTPIAWTVSAGALPSGLSLSPGGVISGTPTTAGGYTFTIKAQNTTGNDEKQLSMTIAAQQSGSSSGGSSGDSSTPSASQPTTTTKDESSTATLVPTTTQSGDTTTASVSASQLEAAITAAKQEADKNGTSAHVEILLNNPADASKVRVTLQNSAFKAMAQGDTTSFAVSSGLGTLTLNEKAMESITGQAKGSDVTIEFGILDSQKGLSDEQRSIVGDMPVYDISVRSRGENIEYFGGGQATTTMPYTLKPGENPNGIVVYYVYQHQNNNSMPYTYETRLETMNTRYDPVTGTVTFFTNHLSLYAIGFDAFKAWSNPFTDMTKDEWFAPAVMSVYEQGLFSGTSATTFSPQMPMTRGMFATVLARLDGADLSGYTATTFIDVDINAYYGKSVTWAADKKILSGLGGGKFAQDKAITREEMAVMLANCIKFKDIKLSGTGSSESFSDSAQISPWAVDAITDMRRLGLISGLGGNKFNPQGTATRAEVAQVFLNYLNATVE